MIKIVKANHHEMQEEIKQMIKTSKNKDVKQKIKRI